MVPAVAAKVGEVRTRSEALDCSAENQEWVGLSKWLVEGAQSTPPDTAAWLHPGLSKPPPEAAPSKVSRNATGPPGEALSVTVLPSSAPFEASTARTT